MPIVSGIVPVNSLPAEDKTLTEADSGKVFIVSQSAAFDITLPATSVAGFTAKFIVGTAGANDIDIVAGTADTITGIELGDTNTSIAAASDKVTISASNAVAGDWVEVVSDGSVLWVTHAAVADAGAGHSG